MFKATRRAWWSTIVLAACSTGCLLGCSGDPTDPAPHESVDQRLEGQLRRVVISDPERGVSRVEYFLELADATRLKLEFDSEPEFEPNLAVLVRGERVGSILHVSDLQPAATPDEEPNTLQQALIAASPKRVAVVLFNFAGDTRQPIDAAAARERIFSGSSSSNAYFKEVSFGVRSLVGSMNTTGDVFGWYTIDQTSAGCAFDQWGTAARAKAGAAGVNLNNYDHVIHYFPGVSSCGFAGVAEVTGKNSWINGNTNAYSDSQTITHELGHNFGLHHAGSYRCASGGAPVPIGGTCTANEYGDPFDVMGMGYRHLNAYNKEKLSFLEAANVKTVTTSGSFAIAPLEQKATGLQVLKFPIPGTSDVYYVEYRQPFGFDSFRTTDPVANGVLIHRVTIPSRGAAPTKLIDTVPSTSTFADAPLLVGKTFTDTAAKVAFTLTARSATSATVQVTVNGGTENGTCAAGESRFGGHCYFRTTSAQTFPGAQATCRARGAGWDVASIQSAAENSHVAALIGNSEHWLGGSDSVTEGTFVWPSGATFWTGGAKGSAPAGVYANFTSDEPNDTGDCLRMMIGGQWRDIYCDSTYRAVCEK